MSKLFRKKKTAEEKAKATKKTLEQMLEALDRKADNDEKIQSDNQR